jgi:biotin synthase
MSPRDGAPGISVNEAAELIRTTSGSRLQALLDRAARDRAAAFGHEVGLCAIVNAKSGICSEDCSFCAQSSHAARVDVSVHGLLPARRLVECATTAEKTCATAFSIVTSGRSIASESEMVELEKGLEAIRRKTGLMRCASLGFMDEARLGRLRRAGLQRYHHNLETARSFFPALCTTHDFDDKLATLRAAKAAGLSVCSGGLFGAGETPEQRVELAETLRRLGVDAIPINFLDARPGTALEHQPRLAPEECLATIAVFRLMLPRTEIIVMGGREAQLGAMQSAIFRAGATGTLIGDYLTTPGSRPREVLAMVAEQGLSPRLAAGHADA